jgi:hypothetical protein
VAPSVTERAYLLDPTQWLAQRILCTAGSDTIECFARLRESPRQRPPFAITGATRQQNRQLISHRRDQNYIDGEGTGPA